MSTSRPSAIEATLRILHLTPYYAPAYAFGGVPRVVEGLARAQAAAGHEVSILTTDAAAIGVRIDPQTPADADAIRVTRVANVIARGRLNLSTPWGIGDAARRLLADTDVLHVHEFRTVEALRVLPIARRLGVPVVVTPHGTLSHASGRSALKRAWDRLLSPRVAGAVTALHALTEDESSAIAEVWRGFAPAVPPIVVIPNGVDAAAFARLDRDAGQAFRRAHGVPEDATLCLFFGRLHPRKGGRLLVEAWIDADVAGAFLLLAGADEGDGEAIRARLAGRTDARWVGFLEGADRIGALAAADLFALPAVGEGLPLALMEALAAGVPAIITPDCHLPAAESVGAARIIPPERESLRDALRDLLRDPTTRARMSRAARALIADGWAWEAVAKRLENVYRGQL